MNFLPLKTSFPLVKSALKSLYKRNVSFTRNLKSAYEGEGKTTVTVLNTEVDMGLMINGISEVGFRLNNDTTVLGPMLIFPKMVFSWSVASASDINEDSLVMFSMIEPKPDLIVIGVGDKITDRLLFQRLLPVGKKFNISMEILPTEQACSTFNFLNAEGRFIGAALIPPTRIEANLDDVLNARLQTEDLMKVKWPSPV